MFSAALLPPDFLVNSLAIIFRGSRPKVFPKKGLLRNFAKFTGKYLCQSVFFNKVAGRVQLVTACQFVIGTE